MTSQGLASRGSTILGGHVLSPEQGVLLQALRSTLDTNDAAPDPQLLERIDGPALLDLAEVNRVSAVLDFALGEAASATRWRQVLRERTESWRRESFYRIAELCRVCKALADTGIDCMPIKGPSLALRAYSSPALREFGDLDVLVRAEQLAAARVVVESLDFRSPYQNVRLHERHHIVYHQELTRSILELHWALAGHQYPDYRTGAFLWEGARRTGTLGVEAFQPRAEHLYVYLCVHGFRHDWERLQWVYDLPHLARSVPDFDWARVADCARACGAFRAVAHATQVAGLLFPGGLPEASLKNLGAPRMGRTQQRLLLRRLFSTTKSKDSATDLFMLRLKGFDRSRDKLRFLASRLAPSDRDREFLPLPWFLTPLQILVRPIRIISKAFRGSSRPRRP